MSTTANASITAAEKAAMALAEEKDSELRVRKHSPRMTVFISAIAVVWAVFQMVVSSFPILDAVRLRVWHILFLLALSFLIYPAWRKKKRPGAIQSVSSGLAVTGSFFAFGFVLGNCFTPIPLFSMPSAALLAFSMMLYWTWRQERFSGAVAALFDMICIAGGFFAFGYFLHNYDTIVMRGGFFLPMDHSVAALGILACFAMAFRSAANLAWLAFAFMAYCFLGELIPGAFGHAGFSWKRVAEHMFWGTQGILGVGVGVSATYIFLFVLFGSFLRYSGFSAFINDLSLTLVGRTAGGPAKVAVIASALMGMINGSALANVATTGAITIPLMKRTGYKAEFAGAVEAVASTGGQFAPPIMGAVGFIMAEFLGVPYTKVMLAAAIPAFLYYLALIMAVHFEARKLGLKGLAKENIPDAMVVIKKRGHLIIPLVVLLVVLFRGYTPLYAATASIISTVIASWLSKETRMNLKMILKAMDEGARSAVGVGAACVIIGVIIGTVSLTGLGLTFGYEVLKFVKEGQLFMGGIFVMVMSVILGMGVPGVAAYVIVAAVAVPVLLNIGASPMAAHMFCLFYACLSNITPPVAMSSYVAAGIARSDQTKTSLIAVKLGLAGFILPFFFLDNPLLLYDSSHDTALTIFALASASLGVCALAAGLEGWLLGPCNGMMRLLLLITAFLAIDPNLVTDAFGLTVFVIVLFWSRRKDIEKKAANPQTS